ncbi:MAG: alpha/beta fold hydrolase [Nocardioides sp.]
MFPLSPPRVSGSLTMDDGQSVHWEESGIPGGIAALYLHGGPGGGLGTGYVTRLDPERFRIIGLDQRGCGRSTPLANDPRHDLDANTTPRLIADLEALREHLGVDAWVLNGVSWGSTLALAYAQAHPDRVLGIVLMAVTTTSRAEVDQITEGVGASYPEAWDRFAGYAEQAGVGYRRGEGRLVTAYAGLVRDPDPAVRRGAAEAWAAWEDTHVAIGAGGFRRDPRWDDADFTEIFVRLTTHYWSHDGFLEPPILARMASIAHLPATLIHGRLDVSSPLVTAWRLHRAWPASELVVDEGEGHGGLSMVEEWAAANSRLADRLDATG